MKKKRASRAEVKISNGKDKVIEENMQKKMHPTRFGGAFDVFSRKYRMISEAKC